MFVMNSLIMFILIVAYTNPMFKQQVSVLAHDTDRDVFHLIQRQGVGIIHHLLCISQQT